MIGRLWADLLCAIPTARLLIAGIDPAAHKSLRQRIDGIPDDRIEMTGRLEMEPYLQLHNRVDISLDPFPWAGHTTTCHSLWMGVPVISLAGPTAVSRAGASIMGALGMDGEWVASTPADYIRIAREWAGRPGDLARLRGGLRERLASSPLVDAGRFTRNLEAELRRVWAGK
jgi:predicted O-linked N-acetylglucosamine transferase (SPINDLY family)